MVPPLEDTTLSVLLYLRSPKEDAGVFAGRALRCVPSTWIKDSKASQARESACGESTIHLKGPNSPSRKWHGFGDPSPHHHRHAARTFP
jgi:hypothetical protein